MLKIPPTHVTISFIGGARSILEGSRHGDGIDVVQRAQAKFGVAAKLSKKCVKFHPLTN